MRNSLVSGNIHLFRFTTNHGIAVHHWQFSQQVPIIWSLYTFSQSQRREFYMGCKSVSGAWYPRILSIATTCPCGEMCG